MVQHNIYSLLHNRHHQLTSQEQADNNTNLTLPDTNIFNNKARQSGINNRYLSLTAPTTTTTQAGCTTTPRPVQPTTKGATVEE